MSNLVSGGTSTTPKFEQLSNKIQANTTWNSSLEGRLLTLVDALLTDREQKEAFKSILKQEVRAFYRDSNQSVMRLVNEFTYTFEGEPIEYQPLRDIMENRDYDYKSWVKDARIDKVPMPASNFESLRS